MLNLLVDNTIGTEKKMLHIKKGEEGMTASTVQRLSLTSGKLLNDWNFDML